MSTPKDVRPAPTTPSQELGPQAALAGGPRLAAGDLVAGRLPRWGTWAVYGAAAVLVLALAAATSTNRLMLIILGVIAAGIAVYAWSVAVEGRRKARDRTVTLTVTSAFAIAIAPLVSLLWTVVSRGAARFDGAFFTESARNVVGAGGGAYHAIVGTLVITLVTTAASVPIGVMAAIYLQEYGHGRLKRALIFFVDVMTGIPSIVAGLFAYALFAIFLGPGVRLGIVGAVALSVLMIPIVVRSTEEMLKIVPDGLREASYALGVPKWRTIISVVLPTALPGIVTGVMVAVSRVIGETAPLLITTGTFSTVNWNPFTGRMPNLPVFAYDQYRNPGVPKGPYIDRAWAAALTLIIIVMLLNVLAGFVSRRKEAR
jgi:phosphate transport system permease protein